MALRHAKRTVRLLEELPAPEQTLGPHPGDPADIREQWLRSDEEMAAKRRMWEAEARYPSTQVGLDPGEPPQEPPRGRSITEEGLPRQAQRNVEKAARQDGLDQIRRFNRETAEEAEGVALRPYAARLWSERVLEELLERAYRKFPKPQSSLHEGYAVLLEEVEELWEAIKNGDSTILDVQGEAIQVAAMAVRLLVDAYGTSGSGGIERLHIEYRTMPVQPLTEAVLHALSNTPTQEGNDAGRQGRTDP